MKSSWLVELVARSWVELGDQEGAFSGGGWR